MSLFLLLLVPRGLNSLNRQNMEDLVDFLSYRSSCLIAGLYIACSSFALLAVAARSLGVLYIDYPPSVYDR